MSLFLRLCVPISSGVTHYRTQAGLQNEQYSVLILCSIVKPVLPFVHLCVYFYLDYYIYGYFRKVFTIKYEELDHTSYPKSLKQ